MLSAWTSMWQNTRPLSSNWQKRWATERECGRDRQADSKKEREREWQRESLVQPMKALIFDPACWMYIIFSSIRLQNSRLSWTRRPTCPAADTATTQPRPLASRGLSRPSTVRGADWENKWQSSIRLRERLCWRSQERYASNFVIERLGWDYC